ncbi:MAG: UvrB/UvrC motif-containing protein [Gemmatimonadota bacterium]|nr:UvrB/UvrC motif-containing protein [Gemmatimonadota bacterium]
MSTFHLCDACAAAKGLEPGVQSGNAVLTDFLAQMGKGIGPMPATGECPFCGTTLAELKRTGRLSCAECYEHFQQHLRGLLRKLHGGSQHAGKAYRADPSELDPTIQLADLRRGLQLAVGAEDFERAASLRDQIRRMEAEE